MQRLEGDTNNNNATTITWWIMKISVSPLSNATRRLRYRNTSCMHYAPWPAPKWILFCYPRHHVHLLLLRLLCLHHLVWVGAYLLLCRRSSWLYYCLCCVLRGFALWLGMRAFWFWICSVPAILTRHFASGHRFLPAIFAINHNHKSKIAAIGTHHDGDGRHRLLACR